MSSPALRKLRDAMLSNRHRLPVAIHDALQMPHSKAQPRSKLLRAIEATVMDSKSPASAASARLAQLAPTATPETTRPFYLAQIDEITKVTSAEGLGLGKRDHVVDLGRGMFVPVEMVAQKVRAKFWHRI